MIAIKYKQLEFKSLPFPIEINFGIPENTDNTLDLPILYFLHGGGGDHSFLIENINTINKLIAKEILPPMLIICPNVKRSQYLDYENKKELWENVLVKELPDYLEKNFRINLHQDKTCLLGISMGGLGALRMAFKYPDKFGIVAAIEPGIVPSFDYDKNIQKHNFFFRSKEDEESIFGSPINKEYWKQNNPVFLAIQNHKSILKNNLKIYLECGNCDSFRLYEGAAFLHSELNKVNIKHEYHVLHNIDHVGPYQKERIKTGLSFIGRMLIQKNPSQEEINFKKHAKNLFKNY